VKAPPCQPVEPSGDVGDDVRWAGGRHYMLANAPPLAFVPLRRAGLAALRKSISNFLCRPISFHASSIERNRTLRNDQSLATVASRYSRKVIRGAACDPKRTPTITRTPPSARQELSYL
jgi:hypothetical protein